MSTVRIHSSVPQAPAGTKRDRLPDDPVPTIPPIPAQPVIGPTGATRESVADRTPAEISSTAAVAGQTATNVER